MDLLDLQNQIENAKDWLREAKETAEEWGTDPEGKAVWPDMLALRDLLKQAQEMLVIPESVARAIAQEEAEYE